MKKRDQAILSNEKVFVGLEDSKKRGSSVSAAAA